MSSGDQSLWWIIFHLHQSVLAPTHGVEDNEFGPGKRDCVGRERIQGYMKASWPPPPQPKGIVWFFPCLCLTINKLYLPKSLKFCTNQNIQQHNSCTRHYRNLCEVVTPHKLYDIVSLDVETIRLQRVFLERLSQSLSLAFAATQNTRDWVIYKMQVILKYCYRSPKHGASICSASDELFMVKVKDTQRGKAWGILALH